MDTYGRAFIDRLAQSTGQSRIVLADEHVLADAGRRFSNVENPVVAAYGEYLTDHADFAAVLTEEDNQMIAGSLEKTQTLNSLDRDVNTMVTEGVKNDAAAAFGQPNGDSAFVIIPTPERLENYGTRIASGLSGLDPSYLGDVPGTGRDWAELVTLHEVGHVAQGHSQRGFDEMLGNLRYERPLVVGMSRSESYALLDRQNLQESRTTLEGEIEADISARRDFMAVSGGAGPDITAAFEAYRVIGAFTHPGDMHDFANAPQALNDHNTGAALGMARRGEDGTAVNLDQTQYDTAYANTLVRGLIGATEGPAALAEGRSVPINNHEFGRFNQRSLDSAGFDAAMAGEAPMRIVSLGRAVPQTPQHIYAATTALLEGGEFDSEPGARANAQAYVDAIRTYAPRVVNPELVDRYRASLAQDSTQGLITDLQELRRDDPVMASRDVSDMPEDAPAAPPPPAAAAAPP
jgi:hypothetical protein